MKNKKTCPLLVMAGAAFYSARAADGVKNLSDLVKKHCFRCFGEDCGLWDDTSSTCGLVKNK